MEKTRWPGIYRSDNGRYRVVVSYRGGQKWVTADSLREARKRQSELRDLAAQGWAPGKATVAGYAPRFLDGLERPNTRLRYEQSLRLHVLPTLGNRRLGDVTTRDVKALRNSLSPTLGRYALTVLSALYKAAMEADLVDRNPVIGLLPEVKRPRARFLDADGVRSVLETAHGHRLEGAVILGLCGLRISEAVVTTWADVNLTTRELTVSRQFFGPLKADGGKRTFRIPKFAVEAFRRHRLAQAEHLLALGARPDAYTPVQTTVHGRAFHPRVLSAAFGDFAKEAGVNATFHTLRHSFATLQITKGADVRTVSERLGHASPMTTLRIYAHATEESDQKAADILDAAVSGEVLDIR